MQESTSFRRGEGFFFKGKMSKSLSYSMCRSSLKRVENSMVFPMDSSSTMPMGCETSSLLPGLILDEKFTCASWLMALGLGPKKV